MPKRKHPMQPIHIDGRGVARFVENRIVRALVDEHAGGLNNLAARFMHDHREDYEQLMMLIGYSVSGFGDLPSSSARTVVTADRRVARLLAERRRTTE